VQDCGKEVITEYERLFWITNLDLDVMIVKWLSNYAA